MSIAEHFSTEESDPYCLSALESAALLFDAPWRRFGVIGDSLSAGTGDPRSGYASLSWADRVADALRRVAPDLAYLNTAVDGATTEQAFDQLDRMIDFAPDLLHLPCGANDIVRRTPDYALIEGRLRELYRRAAATGAQLTTFTLGRAYRVPVFADWTDRVRTVNAITRRVAAEYRAVVVDMWDHPVNDRADLLSADRIHFATNGQAVLAAETVKQLAHRLGQRVAS
ncbi:SGNH/GDSL hydrolase family protein [Nocardia bhagyanarayanae]|uniref:Lysophospholipase L1-like esterase n=1 Tax=Nocardia bhagyanarayanae TaxID=1215925 RepID=A0A543FB50_9NOCA|nr:SGNH/GDSL hydrolase family protein [Nocardia bhagyanarayanae]TQM31067.1 lysophospholipase L1-like esterase [Nocardia bhagyanarayanae]